MKRAVIITVVVLLLLGVVAVVGDRVAASVAQDQISQRVKQELNATSVDTTIHGIPVVTQAIGGSLDHVTVVADGVPTEHGTLDSVVVDLYGVPVQSPRIVQRVQAQAVVPLAVLQEAAGDSWKVGVSGDALTATFTGAIPVEVSLVPVVRDGTLSVDLKSLSLLGVAISVERAPEFVTKALDQLIASVGALPLGLTPTSVQVVPEGVQVVAEGTSVDLDA